MKSKGIESQGEFGRIQAIARAIGEPSKNVIVGIGDDAAVVHASGSPLLLCTDAMVEGIHFDLAYTSARDLGHRSLASVLSDIAAMNGRARYALFSLACPQKIDDAFLEEFYQGARELAKTCQTDIVGGDLTASKSDFFIDVVAVGEAQAPISRSGAQPGDLVVVSGFPGASAAGLHALRSGKATSLSLAAAHLRPRPRFDLLPQLNADPGLCTSLIDISDGLSSELHHIASRSNVGFEIEEAKIPLSPESLVLARQENRSALDWALSGGEDYELLATLSPAAVARLGSIPAGFTLIGKAVPAEHGITLVDPKESRKPLIATGYNHFPA